MRIAYKIPLTLILTLLMVVIIKLTLPEPFVNKERKNKFWIQKTHSTKQFNVVVGGDSRILRGFSIEAMTEKLPDEITGMNLGYCSAGFSEEYLNFLERRLCNEGKRFMVLGVSPHSFTVTASKNEVYHEYKDKGQFDVFEGLYLSRFLEPIAPYTISQIKNYIFNIPAKSTYYGKFQESGWMKSHKIPEDSLVSVDIYRRIFSKYQVSDSMVNKFFSHIEEIGNKGIQIIGFRPPTFNTMSNLEDSLSGYDESYMRREMEKRGCIWIDFRNEDFHTYDGSHLHFKSAEKLSSLVGDRINKILKASKE